MKIHSLCHCPWLSRARRLLFFGDKVFPAVLKTSRRITKFPRHRWVGKKVMVEPLEVRALPGVGFDSVTGLVPVLCEENGAPSKWPPEVNHGI